MRLTQTLIAILSVALGVAAFTSVSAIDAWQGRQIRELTQEFAPDVLVVRMASVWPDDFEFERGMNYGITSEEALLLANVDGVTSVAFRGGGSTILGSNIRITRVPVSEEIFGVLGLQLSSGHALTEEDRLFDLPVAVIGATVAEELFGGAEQAQGQIVELGARMVARVDGVLAPIPEGVNELAFFNIAALVPNAAAFAMPGIPNNPRPAGTMVFIKHAPGAADRAARGVREMLDSLPIGPVHEVLSSDVWLGSQYVFRSEVADELGRGSSWIVLLALIATVGNLANTLGLRAADRAKGVAVRRALGANNLRVAGEIVADGLFIGALGTAIGLALWPLADRLMRIGGDGLPVTPQAFAYAAGAGLVITILAVVVPTIWTLRLPINRALREELAPPVWEGVALTGMAAGVLALVVASSIGSGAERWFQQRLREVGGDRVVVSNQQPPFSRVSIHPPPPVDEVDAAAIAAIPGISEMVISIWENTSLVHGDPENQTFEPISGARVDEGFFEMFPRPILHGRVPRDQSETIIGTYIAEIVYPDLPLDQVVGRPIQLGRPTGIMQVTDVQPITIVGVYASQPFTSMGDLTDAMIVRLRQPDPPPMAGAFVRDFHLRIDPAADFTAVLDEIRAVIDARHGGSYAPATVYQPAGDLRSVHATMTNVAAAWTTIAWISLFVGGAGLASIVIVRLVRNRPELALKRALGATRARIATVSTAMALRIAGYAAITGLVLAGLMSYWISTLAPWSFAWPWQHALVALVAAVATSLAAVLVPVAVLSRTPPWSVLKEE